MRERSRAEGQGWERKVKDKRLKVGENLKGKGHNMQH